MSRSKKNELNSNSLIFRKYQTYPAVYFFYCWKHLGFEQLFLLKYRQKRLYFWQEGSQASGPRVEEMSLAVAGTPSCLLSGGRLGLWPSAGQHLNSFLCWKRHFSISMGFATSLRWGSCSDLARHLKLTPTEPLPSAPVVAETGELGWRQWTWLPHFSGTRPRTSMPHASRSRTIQETVPPARGSLIPICTDIVGFGFVFVFVGWVFLGNCFQN